MRAPKRQAGTVNLTDQHRDKIIKANILTRLTMHANGKVDMKPTEVTAAIALLKKVLPDLAAVQHSGEVAMPYAIVLPMSETAEDWEAECVQEVKPSSEVH